MEQSNLENLPVDLQPDFFTPKRQVEQLEKTSAELNNINTRVAQTLMQYETNNSQDDVFQLLDEDDDVQFITGFDRESIMEESKGKVQVLIVDYQKLGLKRESVLSGLKEWFEEMKNDNLGEYEPDTDTVSSEETVQGLLATAYNAKDRLLDIYQDVLECMKTLSSRKSFN
jgi:hypothetical protein